MKICYLAVDYETEHKYGGLGTYIYHTAHEMARRGHTVHVIAKGDFTRDFDEGKVHVHQVHPNMFWADDYQIKKRFRIRSLPRDFMKFITERWLFRTMMSIVTNHTVHGKFKELSKSIDFDIVEADDCGGIGLAATFRHAPVVTKLHTSWYIASTLNKDYRARDYIDRRIVYLMEYLQFHRSKGLTSNSESLKELSCRIYHIDNVKVKVIHPSIDVSDIVHKARTLSASKKAIHISGDYMLYIGRIEPRKGVEELCNAARMIFEHDKNIKLVLAGGIFPKSWDGLYHRLLRSLSKYKHRVIFLDRVDKERLYPLILQAKVIVLPSRWEAFGYSCLESLALGKIIVAAGGSGFEEQIGKDGKAGILFQPSNTHDLKDKLMTALSMDASQISRMSRNAKVRAMMFDNKSIVPKVESYYKKVLSKNRK